MALIERIITVYNDKGSKQAVKDVNKLEKSFKEAGKKIAKAFLVAGAAAGALAIKIGKDSVQAAIADQKSQVLLANALRNTTGATDASIVAAEEYISAMQAQFSIADDDLRPSLAALARVTGDLGQAQALQNVAIDVAGGTTLDLMTVTKALGKVYSGNLGSLAKLGINLDQNIIKSKDSKAAIEALAKIYAGDGAAAADTFEGRMRNLSLTYGDIIEQLGYALIPVLSDFATTIRSEVLPVLQTFIENNKEGIAEGLRDSINAVIGITKALGKMFKLIADNTGALKVFAGIIVGTFVGTKIAAGIQLIAAGIAGLITLFKRQAVAAGAAGTATALATGGATALSAAAGLAAFGAAAAGTIFLINKFTDSVTTSTIAVKEYNSAVVGHLADLKNLEKAVAANTKFSVANLKVITNTVKKTKEQIATEKALAKLKKEFGIVATGEKDPIQLEAARLNLVRQSKIAEADRVKQMMDALEAQMKMNQAAQRYADLLQVLSDSKISDQEVSVLASKWNMTKGEVLEYIARIYAANSTEVDEGPVIQLLMAWGLTKQEAQKYVDFTRALKDEKLDDAEIEKLMGKWKMTRAEVLYYAKQVQAGTTFSTTWDDPGKLAEQSWLDALAALNAYLTALKSQTPTVPTPVVPGAKPEIKPIPITPGAGGDAISAVPVVAKSIASTLDDVRMYVEGFSNMLANPQLNFVDVGGGVFETQTTTGGGISSFLDYLDATPNSSGFGGRLPFGTTQESVNVTINVAGNVVSEQDLTTVIRDNILQGQKQGEAISYNVFAI